MLNCLAGRCIAVTRPKGQADGLIRAVQTAGGVPLLFPLIGIAAVNPSDSRTLLTVIDQIDQFDMAFFVSSNAVHCALDAIESIRAWPDGLVVSTVGTGSLEALRTRGFEKIIAPDSGFDSEAVLLLPEFSPAAIRGKQVVIFRGDGGRNLLGKTLVEYGADVTYVTCYRRYTPEIDPAILMEPATRGGLDAILFTSSEGVRNLVTIVGYSGLTQLQQIPVFVSHLRIAAEARAQGFTTIITAQPGDASIMESLRHYFNNGSSD